MNKATTKNGEGRIAPTTQPLFQPIPSTEIITESGFRFPVVPCLIDPPSAIVFWHAHCRTWHRHGLPGDFTRRKVGELVGHRAPHCTKPPPEFAHGYYLRLEKVIPPTNYRYYIVIGELTPAEKRNDRETAVTGKTRVTMEQVRGIVSRVAEIDPRFSQVRLPAAGVRLSELTSELTSIAYGPPDAQGVKRHVNEIRRWVLAAARYMP